MLTCIGVGGCGGEECHPVGVVGDDLADTTPENRADQNICVENQSSLDLHYFLALRRAALNCSTISSTSAS